MQGTGNNDTESVGDTPHKYPASVIPVSGMTNALMKHEKECLVKNVAKHHLI